MTRRSYRNPPVHEVILDLQFDGSADLKLISDGHDHLERRYGRSSPLSSYALKAVIRGSGPTGMEAQGEFLGWEFTSDPAAWILRAQANQLTLHSVRSENWPEGKYLGWEKIYEEWCALHSYLKGAYGSLQLRRAGLRYINRLAIPAESAVQDWLSYVPGKPDVLDDLYMFSMGYTWASVGGKKEYSAGVRMGRVPVPDTVVEGTSSGVLLDIDIFNLVAEHAPQWDDAPQWFVEAHAFENSIFEAYVTDQARSAFDQD